MNLYCLFSNVSIKYRVNCFYLFEKSYNLCPKLYRLKELDTYRILEKEKIFYFYVTFINHFYIIKLYYNSIYLVRYKCYLNEYRKEETI